MLWKSSQTFVIEKIKGNPYNLVCNILKFAANHKTSIEQKASTHCDEEHPSRLDFGKQMLNK